MDYSNHGELVLPLVGTLPQEVQNEESEKVPPFDPATNESSTSSPPKHQDILINIALFFLMLIHFDLIFRSDSDHVIDGINWSTINISSGLFIVATYLYRNALTDCGISNDAAMLLPEIIVLASMGLVFYYHVLAAFLLLAIGKFFMAFTVVVINSYRLWFTQEDAAVAKSTEDDIV
jgi:hypothetical protein